MKQPLLVGVSDVLGQLIGTDNSTVVLVAIPAEIKALGSTQAVALSGIASFAFTFSAFTTATFNFTFYSPRMSNFTVTYQFRDCQSGEIRSPSGCFPCPKSAYSLDPSDSRCSICPAHAQCFGRNNLEIDAEYWRADNLTDHIYACLVPEACRGGVTSACAPGYQGTLCNSCSKGYYRYAGWSCRDCDTELPGAARAVLIALLALGTAAVPPLLFLINEGTGWRLAISVRVAKNYIHAIMFISLLHAEWGFATLTHHEILRILGSFGGFLLTSNCQYDENPLFFQTLTLSLYPLLLALVCLLLWPLVRIKRLSRAAGLVTLACISAAIYNFLPVLCFAVVALL